jgi:hypothetical protein
MPMVTIRRRAAQIMQTQFYSKTPIALGLNLQQSAQISGKNP